MQNPFVWHELMTTDVEGAKAFYGKVVGWTFQDQGPDYQVTLTDNHGTGGIMAAPPHLAGMPPFWSGYIYTPDVDATCKKLVALDGSIHRPAWNIENLLRMAVVADPTGAVFNIMQPLSQENEAPARKGAFGTVGWNELHAGDLASAWTFYATLFGWTKGVTMAMGPMGDYQIFQIDGEDAGGMMKQQPMLPRPMWLYYFLVDGIDAAMARISAAGGTIAMGPHQVPGGQWIVSGFDPQGGNFQLLSATR